jgi:hypothetical protein
MADATVSNTVDRKVVWVRIPPSAPRFTHESGPLAPIAASVNRMVARLEAIARVEPDDSRPDEGRGGA